MPVLNRDFRTGIPGAETFNRTGDKTALDFEGILRTYESDNQAIVGTRVVRNLSKGETDFTAFGGSNLAQNGDGTATLSGLTSASQGSQSHVIEGVPTDTGEYLFSIKVRGTGSDIGKDVRLQIKRRTGGGAGQVSQVVTLTADYQLITTPARPGLAGNTGLTIGVAGSTTGAGSAAGCVIKDPMVELVSGQANQNPSSYSPPGITHYLTENGNTASAGVVTEAEGAAITTAEGLLLEAAGTNLVVQSNDATTSWVVQRTVVTADDAIGADGTLTADKVSATNVSGTHNLYGTSVTKAASALPYTATWYISPDEHDVVMIRVNNANDTGFAFGQFDLTGAGAIQSLVSSGGFGTPTGTIKLLANGVYKLTVTAESNSDTTINTALRLYKDSTTSVFVGDNVEGVHVWGRQLEEGEFSTSTIETTTAAATRNADDWLLTGQDFGVNDITGHLVFRPQFDHDDDKESSARLMHLIGPSHIDQGVQIFFSRTSKNFLFAAYDESGGSSPTAAVSSGPDYSTGDLVNLRFRKSSAGLKLWIDGASDEELNTAAQEDFDASLTDLSLNSRRASGAVNPPWVTYQHISIATGADALSDAELEALTTDYTPFQVARSGDAINGIIGMAF